MVYMSRIHYSRTAALNAHRRFVYEVSTVIGKMGLRNLASLEALPGLVGARLLPFRVFPTLERTFGYRGDLRFVGFGYSAKSRRFGHFDGADDIPFNENNWLSFLRHPLICQFLPEAKYPTLYGTFANKAQGRTPLVSHCLLLDRKIRRLYLSERDQAILLFALLESGEEKHTGFVDGLLMSPGNENYKDSAPRELADELRVFLDRQMTLLTVTDLK